MMKRCKTVVLGCLTLLWTTSASAQSLIGTVARDPATYAPVVAKYAAMQLDWNSSQPFFQHGFGERNARFTVSGQANDEAINYGAGNRKIALHAGVLLAECLSANLAERVVERMLIGRFENHQKVWRIAGHVIRIAGSSYLSYTSSIGHLRQWQRNERLARQMRYK
jgi:hypothetical protein